MPKRFRAATTNRINKHIYKEPVLQRAFFISNMHRIRQLTLFLIRSNLFIALCSVAFVFTGASLLGKLSLSLQQAVLIFSATFLTYNLTIFLINLLDGRQSGAGNKMGWFLQNCRILYLLLGLNVMLLLWVFPYHSWSEALFFLHLALISILYNVPDRLANTSYRSIRSIPLLKVFLIAYVWAAIGAVYPALSVGMPNREVGTLFILFFFFILAITLPFDIRDYSRDRQRSLLTVPGVLGIQPTKWLALISMLAYCTGLVIFYERLWSALLIALISMPLIWFSSHKKKEWYYTGLLDGIILIQFFLLSVQ